MQMLEIFARILQSAVPNLVSANGVCAGTLDLDRFGSNVNLGTLDALPCKGFACCPCCELPPRVIFPNELDTCGSHRNVARYLLCLMIPAFCKALHPLLCPSISPPFYLKNCKQCHSHARTTAPGTGSAETHEARSLTQDLLDQAIAVFSKSVLVEQFCITLQPARCLHKGWLILIYVISWNDASAMQLLQNPPTMTRSANRMPLSMLGVRERSGCE